MRVVLFAVASALLGCARAEPETGAVVRIAAGGQATCVGTDDGAVFCTGWNYFGQLGDGSQTQRSVLGRVRGLPPVDQIAMGEGHVCVLARDTRVWCWGLGYLGQVGDGTTTDHATPVRVPRLDGVRAIALGVHVSCALRANEVLCWGDSHFGQLPIAADHSAMPVVVPLAMGEKPSLFRDDDEDRIRSIHAGGATICAVTAAHTAHCWGGGFRGTGQTGLTATSTRRDIDRLALGGEHGCAADASGIVSCWGNGRFGQTLGVAPSLHDVHAFALGTWHSCAIDARDHVLCWGSNVSGQLGDGTRETRSAPKHAAGVDAAIAIAAGDAHTCALVRGGRVLCWGSGQHGQLGDGATEDRVSPVPMKLPR
jgi:alpha-tubulin suppressor-like RCC1 family protein